ncbi:MAG: hypothetical protein ACRDYX_16475 [Egibacteraceae bacterium]
MRARPLTEAHKQTAWCGRSVDLAHFRDRQGAEIDLIVEDRRTGQFTGVKVKLTSTPVERDGRHLARFRARLGERFTVGLVVHAGAPRWPSANGCGRSRSARCGETTQSVDGCARGSAQAGGRRPRPRRRRPPGPAEAPSPIPPTAAMPPAGTPGWR